MEEPTTIMLDQAMRLAFGKRIKQLRKQKQWTQKDLASRLGVRFAQLNKYEGGHHAPPIEKLVELAELLGTTVDFLLTGNQTEGSPLHNQRLLERFQALQECDHEQQELALQVIDALIVKQRIDKAIKPLDKRAS